MDNVIQLGQYRIEFDYAEDEGLYSLHIMDEANREGVEMDLRAVEFGRFLGALQQYSDQF